MEKSDELYIKIVNLRIMQKRDAKLCGRGAYLYYKQNIIGSGGYAVVYKGEKVSTHEEVAIKRINIGIESIIQRNMMTTLWQPLKPK